MLEIKTHYKPGSDQPTYSLYLDNEFLTDQIFKDEDGLFTDSPIEKDLQDFSHLRVEEFPEHFQLYLDLEEPLCGYFSDLHIGRKGFHFRVEVYLHCQDLAEEYHEEGTRKGRYLLLWNSFALAKTLTAQARLRGQSAEKLPVSDISSPDQVLLIIDYDCQGSLSDLFQYIESELQGIVQGAHRTLLEEAMKLSAAHHIPFNPNLS